MKIAIIGYGKMGKEIEKIAINRGHEISLIIDEKNSKDLNKTKLQNIDVAIEFTIPDNAILNYKKCFDAKIPVVSGTTGWLEKLDEVNRYCIEKESAFLYASNFSLGVNIFFEINKKLAKLMNNFQDYSVTIDETHHIQKLDSPSGTAISIANEIIKNSNTLKSWEESNKADKNTIPISSHRKETAIGEHKVKYESDIDSIEIIHNAKNRKGLALGALLAAEFIVGKKGIFNMQNILGL